MKRITLVCAGGMSTSLLVTKMRAAAIKMSIEVHIEAVAENKFKEYADKTDILLLGPQVGFMLEELSSLYVAKGMVVEVIDSVDYGMMNGEKVLLHALNMIKD